MKKMFALMLVAMCLGVFVMGDAHAQPSAKPEKVNGVARLTHSGDIKGSFPFSCLETATSDPAGVQVLVYIPEISVVARPFIQSDQTPYSFHLLNVPAGTYNLKIDVNDVGANTLTTLTVPGVTVQKQRVTNLGTLAICTE